MKEGVSCIISVGGNGYVIEERARGGPANSKQQRSDGVVEAESTEQ